MNTKAAVTTPRGLGAIANIQLAGDDAAKAIARVARPTPKIFTAGRIHVCEVIDGDNVIDHVVIGHESQNNFAISCHGNPFITEAIIKLLQKHGAQIVSKEEMLLDLSGTENTIGAEAKLAKLKAPSIEAVKLIAAQSHQGLAMTAAKWLAEIDALDLPQIKNQCDNILADSAKAKFLITGCKAVIAGAPNSGKSTLINALAGKQKAIVTDIAGTTRDWVSINCRIGPVLVEFIDTAGLDENLTKDDVDKASQQAAHKMIENADLIVYLNDAQAPPENSTLGRLADKTVIFVQNKCDLLSDEQKNSLPAGDIHLSAVTGLGIDKLCDAIIDILEVKGLGPQTPVCFTQRQTDLLTTISNAKEVSDAKTAITQLL
ncbi:MAG: 50S ribosome-binding GTPase [Planctomycetes bacterium]|nr:50S ribosome-binding GTPase [Planctomycetota bacterium]